MQVLVFPSNRNQFLKEKQITNSTTFRPGRGDGGNMAQVKLNDLSKSTKPQDLQPARDSIASVDRSAQIGT